MVVYTFHGCLVVLAFFFFFYLRTLTTGDLFRETIFVTNLPQREEGLGVKKHLTFQGLHQTVE